MNSKGFNKINKMAKVTYTGGRKGLNKRISPFLL
jgi:hypothetical protein